MVIEVRQYHLVKEKEVLGRKKKTSGYQCFRRFIVRNPEKIKFWEMIAYNSPKFAECITRVYGK